MADTVSPPSLLRLRARAVWLVAAMCLCAMGCNGATDEDAAERTSPRLVELDESSKSKPGLVVVAVLDDLSGIFEANTGATEEGLTALRAYIQANRDTVKQAVAALETQQTGLSAEASAEYVDPEQLREAITRFARTQQAFRGGATEAQRIELSEILNSLQ